MSRSNETWVAELSQEGPARAAALRDLRDLLLRSVRKTLSPDAKLDEGLLEDAVQDALLRILDRLSQFKGRSRFLTWAISVAIRMALTDLRRRHWRHVSLDDVAGEVVSARNRNDVESIPDDQDDAPAMLETMRSLIQTELSAKQRTALIAELRGMPQDEIVRHLGSNRNALYKLLFDARRKLKAGLEAAGFRAEDIG